MNFEYVDTIALVQYLTNLLKFYVLYSYEDEM